MNKRNITLLVVLVVVSAVAVYVFKDSFQAEPIQIAYMVRPAPAPRNPKPPTNDRFAPSGKPGFNVTFSFNQELMLKAVRLYELQDAQTNKYPQPIWNLTSESNSPPLKSIVYGGRVRGLRTTVKGAVIDPLVAGQSYRLVIETPDRTAERDFTVPR
jgi:hypothetical protein